ncbi:MAG: hypothetical protein JNK05_11330 [Myxococcales bacterium]|nr:hypothetical protein [Myxococcales bacterium]
MTAERPLRFGAARVWLAALLALSSVGATACRRVRARRSVATQSSAPLAPRSGHYWARIADVPEGMRVRLSLESDGTRVRGAYTAQPWDGEFDGVVRPDGALALKLYERGVTQSVGARDREVVLRREDQGARYVGQDREGHVVELVRAPMGDGELRPGLWLARWTGLPAGMASEIRVSRDPDGRWRGVYQYQSGGGSRDGSFQGTLSFDGTLDLEWTETNDGTTVARGRATLRRARFGLRGSYGIEGHNEGVGEWIFEPLVAQ